MWKLRYNLTFS